MSRYGLFGFGSDPDDEPVGPSAFGEVQTLDFSVSAADDDASASGDPAPVPPPPSEPAPAAHAAPTEPEPAPVPVAGEDEDPIRFPDDGEVLSPPVTASPTPAARPRQKARAYRPVRDTALAVASVAVVLLGGGYAYAVLSDGPDAGPGAVLTAAGNVLLTGATANSAAGSSTVRVSTVDGSCAGGRGNEDLRAGTPVAVLGADGRQVAAGELGPGAWVPDPESDGWGTCRFGYTVPDVPEGQSFQVRVGAREPVAFPRDTITSADLSLQAAA